MSRALALALLLAPGLSACAPDAGAPDATATAPAPAPVHDLAGEALGTTWRVKWLGAAEPDALRSAVESALAEVDASMSTWRDDSELSRIRAADGPVGVSVDTAHVVQAALELAAATGGAFDPTVQPLVELWGFHGERRATPPTDDELAAARAQVGWERVTVGWTDGSPWVDGGGTALDLSAIAKGHAVDRVSAALSARGVAHHMVEVGGEVRTAGAGPAGVWRVGVDRPEVGLAPGARLEAVVELTNGAVATSGNYRNAYDLEGRRVAHTLDPRTGQPASSNAASATVIAPDCRTADALATALMVLGTDGLALVERWPDVEAMVLVAEDGVFVPRATAGMKRFAPERHPDK